MRDGARRVATAITVLLLVLVIAVAVAVVVSDPAGSVPAVATAAAGPAR